MGFSLTGLLLDRADFVARCVVPGDVTELALDAVLDTLGVALAGAAEPVAAIAARGAQPIDSAGATLIGSGLRVEAGQAALVNGAAAHALDYDDTHTGLPGHPTVPVLAAVLALGDSTAATGEAVLRALLVGVEVECLLGELIGEPHYAAGWHATATLGAFGAAAGCAALLGLDREATEHALGLTAVSAAGPKAAFGTMAKPLQVGMAARNGLLAARWAAGGMTGPSAALDGPAGFAALHGGTPAVTDVSAPDRWRYRDVVFKYHAACFWAHSSIDATRALVAEHGIGPGDVAAVTARVSKTAATVCDRPGALSGLDSKFSIQANVARALSGVDTSAPASYEDTAAVPVLRPIAQRVSVIADPAMSLTDAELELTLHDGRVLNGSARADRPEPDPATRRSRLTDKFGRLTAHLLDNDRRDALTRNVRALPQLPDLRPLASALGTAATARAAVTEVTGA